MKNRDKQWGIGDLTYTQIEQWMMKCGKFKTRSEIEVYAVLYGFWKNGLQVYPSYEHIAQRTFLSRRQVIRICKELREREIIDWVSRPDDTNQFIIRYEYKDFVRKAPSDTATPIPSDTATPIPSDTASHKKQPLKDNFEIKVALKRKKTVRELMRESNDENILFPRL